ncbi:hypothetical protein SCP_0502350 [Sparassis crispa]|uniref:Uncharacterized protein n=1 Tax=Sparassis crispa TaxID=139825 RepID=A0A401GLX8_9APHY|nr:hypothetical protein SCP_0502350 [Sparassis crispa]GBE83188.1 hypothetical protein SCP_0502350 [Sparassis crispa]
MNMAALWKWGEDLELDVSPICMMARNVGGEPMMLCGMSLARHEHTVVMKRAGEQRVLYVFIQHALPLRSLTSSDNLDARFFVEALHVEDLEPMVAASPPM